VAVVLLGLCYVMISAPSWKTPLDPVGCITIGVNLTIAYSIYRAGKSRENFKFERDILLDEIQAIIRGIRAVHETVRNQPIRSRDSDIQLANALESLGNDISGLDETILLSALPKDSLDCSGIMDAFLDYRAIADSMAFSAASSVSVSFFEEELSAYNTALNPLKKMRMAVNSID
jgi:hypothetical protein